MMKRRVKVTLEFWVSEMKFDDYLEALRDGMGGEKEADEDSPRQEVEELEVWELRDSIEGAISSENPEFLAGSGLFVNVGDCKVTSIAFGEIVESKEQQVCGDDYDEA